MKKLFAPILFFLLVGTVFASTTTSHTITLVLSTDDPAVTQVTVSNHSDFSGSQTFAYTPAILWNICSGVTPCSPGVKTVYVQYKNATGAVLGSASKTVTLANPAPAPTPTPTPVVTTPAVVPGCTDQTALNFNVAATKDDGTCSYPTPVVPVVSILGCTDSSALNFNAKAETDNGSCEFPAKEKISPIEIAKGVAVGGGILGLLGIIFAGIMNTSIFSEIGFLPIRIIYRTLMFFGLRKREKSWGVVYDSKTKAPLDPVYVTLLRADNGKEITNALTDIEGRYGFLVPEGSYKLSAGKTHYQFPSAGGGYQGESFVVDQSGVVTVDVPLDPLSFDWNEQEKARMGTVSWFTRHRGFFNAISQILFWLGFVISVVVCILFPTVANGVILAINALLGVIQLGIYKKRSFGMVYDSGTNIPHSGIEIRFTLPDQPSIIIKKVNTDPKGRYYALLKAGEYIATFIQKNGVNEHVLGVERVRATGGMCDRDFLISLTRNNPVEYVANPIPPLAA